MFYCCAIRKEKEDMHIVSFPDLPNVLTYGFNEAHAREMAEEALNACLEADTERGFPLPPAVFQSDFAIPVHNHIVVAYELKKLRGKKSQRDVAQKLGLTYQAYQRLENPRKANPTIKTLEKIAHALGKNLVVNIK